MFWACQREREHCIRGHNYHVITFTQGQFSTPIFWMPCKPHQLMCYFWHPQKAHQLQQPLHTPWCHRIPSSIIITTSYSFCKLDPCFICLYYHKIIDNLRHAWIKPRHHNFTLALAKYISPMIHLRQREMVSQRDSSTWSKHTVFS